MIKDYSHNQWFFSNSQQIMNISVYLGILQKKCFTLNQYKRTLCKGKPTSLLIFSRTYEFTAKSE